MRNAVLPLFLLVAPSALPGDWSAPVEVTHELKPCVTYRARFEGDLLVVRADLQPGWHTFTIDNQRRAAEKLAGRRSIGIDQPTKIKLPDELKQIGVWYQSEPADFSKPEIRWYSWGFEKQAVFASKVSRSGGGPYSIEIRGQTCTDTTCKNIDITLSVPGAPASEAITDGSATDLKTLIEAR
jgi:hypothetical protein